MAPVALVGAMAEEVQRLRAAVVGGIAEIAGPFVVTKGRIEGVDVFLAECGIGKVNAAALTQCLLSMGAGSVIFTGVAGALDPALRVGDIVVGSEAVQHDVDVTALGYAPGEVPGSGTVFAADPRLVKLATAAGTTLDGVRTIVGRIASGDVFVAGEGASIRIRELFAAACAEMEGAACAQVCAAWGTPFVIVRSISDTADHEANIDFRAFTALAAERAEALVTDMLRRLVSSIA